MKSFRSIFSVSHHLIKWRTPVYRVAHSRVFSSLSASESESDIHKMVTKYYGETLSGSKDLKTSACTAVSPPEPILNALKNVPSEVKDKFYGCGNPVPMGIKGLTVLDLGSGSGQDCYVAAQLVGESGKVIGIDMTDEQVGVAKKNVKGFTDAIGYKRPNLEFKKGYIELLKESGIEKESIDLVISNCVINLSPRKDQVLQSVWNSLKWGGEFYFSDVYCDRRLSEQAQNHEVLVGECLGGALYSEDFRRICQRVGFEDVRKLSIEPVNVNDPELAAVSGNAKFYSITYRLFKCKGMEDKCEDFGQYAVYKGTIENHPNYYDLDDHHRFVTNKPMLVCGNTALMVGSSWLGQHFKVDGDTNTHYGLFGSASANSLNVLTSSSSSSDNSSVESGCC